MKASSYWLPAGLLAWTHVLYGFGLKLLPARPVAADDAEPSVTLIIAAHTEEPVIAGKVADALALDYPREKLQVIVACDGSPDRTPELARAAGADLVLELPRGGKVLAQDAAVAAATGDIVAFSDANATWAPDALRKLVRPFADPDVAYVCGQVRFGGGEGGNQEGLYWRHEMQVRTLESTRWSITAGNGAIYAVRRAGYLALGPAMSHDLAFPFTYVKRGQRAVYAPDAQAFEQMVPTIEGEFPRKRRMMSRAWAVVIGGRMLDPRGYPPRYAAMIFSHRALRYASPLLHVWLAASSRRAPRVLVAAQLALVGGAVAGGRAGRLGLIARYYVLTTLSIALGGWDAARHGAPATWDPSEGTRA